MSLFKKIFGRPEKKKVEQPKSESIPKEAQEELNRMLQQMSNKSESTPEEFKNEIQGESFARYYSSPGFTTKIQMKDERGNIVDLHVALKEYFDVWKNIRSPWDKRSVLFEYFDAQFGKKLEKWQTVERLIKDRHGLRALNFRETQFVEEDYRDIRLVVSLSKLYRIMDSLETSLKYANYAYELAPHLDIVKVEYANALHLAGNEEEKKLSHKLISEVLEKNIKQSNKDEIALLNYFMFSKDYLDSSVFALSFLREGNADIESWEKLSEEYYWCPFFRHEHSVYLSQNGESIRAMAKLNSLANEFPWYKAGVLSNISSINQMRKQRNDPNFMNEEMAQMEKFKGMWKN